MTVAFLVAAAVSGFAPGAAVAQDDGNLARRALEDSTFDWRSIESANARIYYQSNSFADRHRAMFCRSVTAMIDEVLAYLGEPGYDQRLNVFYLNSRDEMKRIVGSPVTGLANWEADAIFVVCGPEWRSFEKHEFTHIITMGTWGSPNDASRWMVEGIAVACDGWCREFSVDEIAYHYLASDELPPLVELFAGSKPLGEIRGGMYAASVIDFVRDSYGIEAVKALWQNGPGDLPAILGIDIEQLESAWKNHLKSTVDKDAKVDMDAIAGSGCG